MTAFATTAFNLLSSVVRGIGEIDTGTCLFCGGQTVLESPSIVAESIELTNDLGFQITLVAPTFDLRFLKGATIRVGNEWFTIRRINEQVTTGPTCMTSVEHVVREFPDERWQTHATAYASRACSQCMVDGVPSGLRIIPATQAIAESGPRPCSSCAASGSVVRHGHWDECSDCGGSGQYGLHHSGTVDRLRAICSSWRRVGDACAPRPGALPDEVECVWRDWLMDRGEDAPQGLALYARCPEAADWIEAWSVGRCPNRCHADPRDPSARVYTRDPHGHAVALHEVDPGVQGYRSFACTSCSDGFALGLHRDAMARYVESGEAAA